MSTNHSSEPAIRGLPEGVVDITFHSLADAYAAEGYEQGYARGTRDLLALYPLLIEQYLHTNHADVTPAVRQAIRAFGGFVEDRIGKRLNDAGFIDGSGI